MAKVVVLDCKKELGGGGGYKDILEVKIEDDDHLSSDITWAQKLQRTSICRQFKSKLVWRQLFFKNLYHGFIKFWLISSEINSGYTLWWNENKQNI